MVEKSLHKLKIAAIFFAMSLAVAAAGLYVLSSAQITDYRVYGSRMYTQEEIVSRIIEANPLDRSAVYVYLGRPRAAQAEIPFVQRYEVELTGESSAQVVVYEKSIIGCVRYMSSYLYFDRDGIVVESSFRYINGTPVIDGLSFSQAVLYDPLPVEDPEIFGRILHLTNLLKKNKLNVDKVLYESDSSVVLFLGNVRVKLGESIWLEEKLSVIMANLVTLEGMSGTLYLDNFDPGDSSHTFVFKRDE